MKLNRTGRRVLICAAAIAAYAVLAWVITAVRSDCQDFSSRVGKAGKSGSIPAPNCRKDLYPWSGLPDRPADTQY